MEVAEYAEDAEVEKVFKLVYEAELRENWGTQYSKTIFNMCQMTQDPNDPPQNTPCIVGDYDKEAVDKMIAWITYRATNDDHPPVEEPSHAESERDSTPKNCKIEDEFDLAFSKTLNHPDPVTNKEDYSLLQNVYMLSNHLEIHGLTVLCAKTYAGRLTEICNENSEVEDATAVIREEFGLVDDMSPEDKAKIKEELSWITPG